MSSIIIKSKIWKFSNTSINYREKNYSVQRIITDKSGILSRKKDKITFRKTENINNTSNNSSELTNYMNDARNNELISVEKLQSNPYFNILCGDWSKDISQLVDQNAAYFVYKGLTIENFLKEKQKYYILNQGDILKLGKIYIKILHIKLTGSLKHDEEEEKFKDSTLTVKEDKSKIEDSKYEEDKKNISKSQKDTNLVFYTEPKVELKKLNRKINKSFDDLGKNADNLIKKNIKFTRTLSLKLKRENNKLKLEKVEGDKGKVNNKSIIKQDNNIKKIEINKKNKFIVDKVDKKSKTIDNPENKSFIGKCCRICFSGEKDKIKNPLICPCTCKGSMKFIHYYCLKNWLNLKVESELNSSNLEKDKPTITYNTKDIACELCKTKLPDYIKHRGKIYNVTFYKPKYEKFIVLESVRDDLHRNKFIHIIPITDKNIIKFGRLNTCDLSLPDDSVSRVHCCMYVESGQLFLENNSKFATKILVQNSKLRLSMDYPLSIEVQNTYLKIKVKRPFSLFSCCNVLTSSMSRMLVYQKQNEKGFDLFCSMIFKEDDEEQEDNIVGIGSNTVNYIRENNNITSLIDRREEENKTSILKSLNKIESKEEVNKKDDTIKKIVLINEESKINETNLTKMKEELIDLMDKSNTLNDLKNQLSKDGKLIDIKTVEKDDNNKLISLEKTDQKQNKNVNIILENNSKENIDMKKIELISPIPNEEGLISKELHNNKNRKNNIQTNDKNIKMKNLLTTQNYNNDEIKEEINSKSNEDLIDNIKKNQNIEKEMKVQQIEKEQTKTQDITKDDKSKCEKSSNNKKIPKNIDLNVINDLTYNLSGEKSGTPLDNYQSIFGLIPNKQNKTGMMLAPKHKEMNIPNNLTFEIKHSKNNKNKIKYTFDLEEENK